MCFAPAHALQPRNPSPTTIMSCLGSGRRGGGEGGGLRVGEEARCMCGWQHTHMLMHDTTRDIAGDVTCSLGATWFRICVNTERFFALSHAKRRARLALP